MSDALQAALILVVVTAAWSDLRTRRIPNWMTLPGAAIGFMLQVWQSGWNGAWASLAGAALGLGLFIAFYLLGGMGAGDVKLFGAVGAFTGPQALILVFVCTGLLGGIVGVLLAASRRRLRETLTRTSDLMLDLAQLRWQEARGGGGAATSEGLRLPYGAVIAGGTLASLLLLQ